MRVVCKYKHATLPFAQTIPLYPTVTAGCHSDIVSARTRTMGSRTSPFSLSDQPLLGVGQPKARVCSNRAKVVRTTSVRVVTDRDVGQEVLRL